MDINKPWLGQIHNWEKKFFSKEQFPQYADSLGYVIRGLPVGHPEFVDWIVTSAVVKHEADQIETLNSRYTLVNPR